MSGRKMLVLFLFLALVQTSARPTTLARMSLEELARAADAVVEARCLGNETRREDGEVWTFASFEVGATRKGIAPRMITVRLLGGRLGQIVSRVEGVPQFQTGEEVILFLQRTRAGDFGVTSWMQGTFRVRRDAVTGESVVTQDSSALAVFDVHTRQFRHEGIRRAPLEEFRRRLDNILDKQRSRRE